jgi:putative transposase
MSQSTRRSVRLKGYEYARAGAYFITQVCVGRELLFGEVVCEEMHLNLAGECAGGVLQGCAAKFGAQLGTYVVMPNHLHAVIILPGGGGGDGVGRGDASGRCVGLLKTAVIPDASPLRPTGTVPGSLGAFVQNYKSVSTRRIHALVGGARPIWQRNYYEHIIRNEVEWANMDAYIRANPVRWKEDEEYR